MLRNAWVIPALTFASFWLILFVGRRLPGKGAEIGLAAVGLAFVLSCVATVQWIDRPTVAHAEPGATAGAEHGEGEADAAEQAAAEGEGAAAGEAAPEGAA